MVMKRAKDNPDGIAFSWFDKDEKIVITYREFAEDVILASGKISALLKHDNTNIGLIGINSYPWLVLFIATQCSKNVSVLLDKDMDAEEMADVAQRMDIPLILTDKTCEKKTTSPVVQSLGIESVLFEEVFSKGDNGSAASKEVNIPDGFGSLNDDDTACIFLTSGTTGKRKGVILSHKNIAADINGSCRLFVLKGDALALLPFHHSFGLIVAVWMVFNYNYPVYISQGLRFIVKELALTKPQTLMLVPLYVETFRKQILMAVKKGGKEQEFAYGMNLAKTQYAGEQFVSVRRQLFKDVLSFFGGNLEYIICGGAALDPFYVQEYRCFGIEILNGYGTTECSPVAAVNRNHYRKDGTVGIPLPQTQVKASDDGEILIAGDHVMKGYYKDPAETGAALKDGWYHTGDLGSVDADGFITLTGRNKNLIILANGENISPEELEEKLLRIAGIDEVMVSCESNELVAQIYSKEADDAVKESIQSGVDGLNRNLPMYKRINRVTFREQEFKKTTTQKIIRWQ